ncbi:uncharacterized protein [Physcomitrium patens]|uniref:Uncharacterized protein n=1 Tax=Physcomitrium patens TaxID=3218 RepID=A0A2K1J5A8_PHYPA|nr:uncharacterized protein LOC112294402 isoform X2 [Physcomitrium patens]PNR36713.1 hypothetical protein PHYPA_022564 [Physcomitrium patens]|eukprot:XP_024400518.1 uncharacterized protein LOC112294402 isoform X2 [Physcomitrella patens]
MACLALSRITGPSMFSPPIASPPHSRSLVQHFDPTLNTATLHSRCFVPLQALSNTRQSSLKHRVLREKSVFGQQCCQSHGCSFGERDLNDDKQDFTGDDAILLRHLFFHPMTLLAQALSIISYWRARLHLCRLKFEALCEESQWEDLDGALLQQGSLGMALLSTSMIARDRISPVLITLRANPTFMSGLVAWAFAQVLKVFTKYFVERRWDWKMLVGSGGMPSSHSALCVGLTTAVALCHGVGDSLFPVCLGFTLIVMYDAAGVRRHAGRQAEVLNMIVEDLFQGHPVSEKKLKELLGHTPLQVGAGATLGMICGYICSRASMVY